MPRIIPISPAISPHPSSGCQINPTYNSSCTPAEAPHSSPPFWPAPLIYIVSGPPTHSLKFCDPPSSRLQTTPVSVPWVDPTYDEQGTGAVPVDPAFLYSVPYYDDGLGYNPPPAPPQPPPPPMQPPAPMPPPVPPSLPVMPPSPPGPPVAKLSTTLTASGLDQLNTVDVNTLLTVPTDTGMCTGDGGIVLQVGGCSRAGRKGGEE